MTRKLKTKAGGFGQTDNPVSKINKSISGEGYGFYAFIAALFTFLLYLPTLGNDFVNWDDYQYVFENLHIRTFGLEFFRWAFFDFSVAMYWHPLTWISHAIDYALWGVKPFGHHLTSILLHAVNTGLVVFLIISLLEAINEDKRKTGGVVESGQQFLLITSCVAAILFGIHPLHVESVAWVAMRKDLLYTFFYLLSIMSYIRYVCNLTGTGINQEFYRSGRYYTSLLLFVLAICSKPMAVTLPAVLLLLDWYPLKRTASGKGMVPLFVEKLPFAVVSAVITAVTITTQNSGEVLRLAESFPIATRIPVAFRAVALYVWKTVAPVNLLPLYPYPEKLSFASPEFLLALASVLLITVGCLHMVRTQPFWLAVWGYYIISVAPTLGINQVGSDRYAYLPTLGLFLLIGLAFYKIWEKSAEIGLWARPVAIVAAIALAVSMSLLTLKQIAVWRDSPTLWNYVIDNSPPNSYAYNSRGHMFKNEGFFDKAIEDYSRAIANKPTWATYYVNRGVAYYEKGDLALALEDLNKAAALKPTDYLIFNNRGNVFYRKGLIDKAMDDFNTSITLNPDGHMAYNNRGTLFRDKGDLKKAKEDFDRAIALAPDYISAYLNRSILNNEMGDPDRAMEDINKAIALNPANAPAYVDRGNLFRNRGNAEAARKDYQKACDMGNITGCGNVGQK